MEQLAEERRKAFRGDAAWRIDTISDLSELRRNAWRWLELERESADPDAAFQSFAWCSAWAETWCGGDGPAKLCVKLIYRGATLVALLPLIVRQVEGVRQLTMLGDPHTQIGNALTRSGSQTTDGLRLALAEAEMTSGADMLKLGKIPQDSPLADALKSETTFKDPATPISLVTWPGMKTGEGYLKALSKNRRKDFRRKQRMLEDCGAVSFETIDASSYRFGETVRLALEWKRTWLSRNGLYSDGLNMARVEDFLSDFSTQDGTFTPEIDILSVGHDPVAFAINMTGNGCRHAWLSSYYEPYEAMSPGMLIHQMSIAAAIDAGLTSYSFLGHPSPFKSAMSNETVHLQRYEKPFTPRGKVWLIGWSRVVRPVALSLAKRALFLVK